MCNNFDATHIWKSFVRGGPVAGPTRSLELNILDFFFRGYLKSIVHQTPVDTMEDLTAPIVVASKEIAKTLGMFEGV